MASGPAASVPARSGGLDKDALFWQSIREMTLEDVTAIFKGPEDAATRYFERCLRMPEGKAAAEYLRGRGLDDETITRFRLGYAPDSRTAI